MARVGVQRTPVTWAIYGGTGAWASYVYLAGPVAPVLAADLGVAAGSAGLVGTALAAGLASASVTGPAAVRRLGRDTAMRVGLGAMALATAALATLPRLLDGWAAFALVLALVWAGATGGATFLNSSTARLSEMHPEHSASVITEANAAAAWVGLFSPLLLGAALGAGLGWWVGFVMCLILVLVALGWLVLADRTRREPAPPPVGHAHRTLAAADEQYEVPDKPGGESTPAPTTPLSRRFWLAMVALFAAAGAEFSINFWGSTLIQDATGAGASAATSAISASVLGIAVGRTVGTRVTGRLGPHRTLITGFLLALAGFALLWLAGTLPMAVVGLFVGGLGLATLFPLVIDRSIALSEGRPDTALARATLILGLAIGGAPFVLGALGSVLSVSTAMLLVPLLVALGLFGVVASRPEHDPAARPGAHPS